VVELGDQLIQLASVLTSLGSAVAEARKRGIPVTVIWPEGASRDEAA
jgi:hypothetical protein